jgi:hypothetical protein
MTAVSKLYIYRELCNQLPVYKDKEELARVVSVLRSLPPLVHHRECEIIPRTWHLKSKNRNFSNPTSTKWGDLESMAEWSWVTRLGPGIHALHEQPVHSKCINCTG